MGIATELDLAVDGYMAGFVSSTSASLCSALIPIALTGVTIYIFLMGWAIARGEAQDPLHAFLKQAFKISLIGAVALGGGAYQSFVVDFINGLQTGLVTTVSGSTSIANAIDNMNVPYQDLKKALFQEAFVSAWPSFGILVAAIIVTVAQAWIMFISLGFFLLAKVQLAIILAVGPAFVLCAIWPATQKFTESWIGQALNYVFINVLLAACIAMITSLAKQFAEHVTTNGQAMMVIEATTTLLIVSVTLSFAIKKHDQIAQALAGGVAMGNFEFGRGGGGSGGGGGGGSKGGSGGEIENGGKGGLGDRAKQMVGNAANSVGHAALDTASAIGKATGGLYNRHVLENLKKASKQ